MEKLKEYYNQELKQKKFKDLLNDKERVNKVQFMDSKKEIMLDLSHTKIDEKCLELMKELLKEKGIEEQKQKMFRGEVMNPTEGRKVLHIALRQRKKKEGEDIQTEKRREEVEQVLDEVKQLSEAVRTGEWTGHSGQKLKNILVVGIGGSYLGIEFIYEALRLHPLYQQQDRQMRLLSNVDPVDFKRATEGLDPQQTLVVVNSKTFTTAETMMNAQLVKQWLLDSYETQGINIEGATQKHFVACSTNQLLCEAFGVTKVFRFWDWVGGRFSSTSCIGMLPLSLYFGYEVMQQFLLGAEQMDQQFLYNPLDSNLPTLLGLVGYYNSQVQGLPHRAIIPYCQALSKFTAHIQQLDMESNGKQCHINGQFLTDYNQTGTVIFGEPGTNSQHSFFQLLHQGRVTAIELIGFTSSQHNVNTKGQNNHDELMSNFFSQPDALALGRSREEVEQEQPGIEEKVLLSKVFKGDRGSISILFAGTLDAYKCGQLLSLYEHRVAVEGWLLQVNSFDQMGVELGKVYAKNIAQILHNNNHQQLQSLNLATQNLIHFYRK